LQRGAEQIYLLGARAIFELLHQIGQASDSLPYVLDSLDDWRAGLTPKALKAASGDRVPATPLLLVPR
jgi:hypothetical protein